MFMLVQLSTNMPGATLRSMSSRWGRSSGLKTGGTWGRVVGKAEAWVSILRSNVVTPGHVRWCYPGITLTLDSTASYSRTTWLSCEK